jgi:hypothetical protein
MSPFFVDRESGDIPDFPLKFRLLPWQN